MQLFVSVSHSLGLGATRLTTNHEVAGSIPGTSTILNVD